MFLDHIPTAEDIIKSHQIIKSFIHKTPVLQSSSINNITGANLFFKCENFQKIGAFKFRGATNAISSIPKEILANGVATHSSGNHAAALTLAAKINKIPAYIVMPKTAPIIKKNAVEGYGAQITFCEPTQEARENTLAEIVEKTNAVFVHPYDNYSIIAGQATAAKELLEEHPELDLIISPIGGGGLTSGTCLAAKYFSNGTRVIGAEPSGADDAFRSVRDKKIYPSVKPQTIADGLLTSLSEKTYSIISENILEIKTVQEKTIIFAMRTVWERMKIIIEPSSAVPLAAVLENPEYFAGKKTGIIVSGGNVDLDKLPWL